MKYLIFMRAGVGSAVIIIGLLALARQSLETFKLTITNDLYKQASTHQGKTALV